jgi:hypothetical protein
MFMSKYIGENEFKIMQHFVKTNKVNFRISITNFLHFSYNVCNTVV